MATKELQRMTWVGPDRGTHFTVTAERDEGSWLLRVVDHPGIFSSVKRLDSAEEWIRDAIAVSLEIEPDSFAIEIVPAIDGTLDREVSEAREFRQRAELASEAAAVITAATVHHLVDAGISLRDIGVLLGISFQRAGQLAARPRSEEYRAARVSNPSSEI